MPTRSLAPDAGERFVFREDLRLASVNLDVPLADSPHERRIGEDLERLFQTFEISH